MSSSRLALSFRSSRSIRSFRISSTVLVTLIPKGNDSPTAGSASMANTVREGSWESIRTRRALMLVFPTPPLPQTAIIIGFFFMVSFIIYFNILLLPEFWYPFTGLKLSIFRKPLICNRLQGAADARHRAR